MNLIDSIIIISVIYCEYFIIVKECFEILKFNVFVTLNIYNVIIANKTKICNRTILHNPNLIFWNPRVMFKKLYICSKLEIKIQTTSARNLVANTSIIVLSNF